MSGEIPRAARPCEGTRRRDAADDRGDQLDVDACCGADRCGACCSGSIGAATLAWVVLLVVWEEAPFTLTFDDAYYYFGIARNLVDGHGSTFDQINLTNGYHPLWLLISTVPVRRSASTTSPPCAALLVLQVVVGWGVTLVLVSPPGGRPGRRVVARAQGRRDRPRRAHRLRRAGVDRARRRWSS